MRALLPGVAPPSFHRTGVYFVQATNGAIKIGKSKSIADRLAAVQSCSPLTLSLVGWAMCPSYFERRLHDVFREQWLHGEWFTNSDRLESLIRELMGLPSARRRGALRDFLVAALHREDPLFHPVAIRIHHGALSL